MYTIIFSIEAEGILSCYSTFSMPYNNYVYSECIVYLSIYTYKIYTVLHLSRCYFRLYKKRVKNLIKLLLSIEIELSEIIKGKTNDVDDDD